ncbi:diacylglycerol/lipid kinase family protein [Falsiroseomonas sp.]|uniref:diacylglycerol/lipid kinase family protein n=1 Tax=Falsiroseomonas sp. TaxID=2870721 RepID=UPI003F7053CB
MKLLLLHNDSAGAGDVSATRLQAAFREAGFAVTYRAQGQARLAAADLRAADVLVVAGGDGTVAGALRDYRGEVPRFAIVPLGTANNIATSLGLTGCSPEAIAAGLREGRDQPVDIARLRRAEGEADIVEGLGAGAIAAAIQAADRDDLPGETNHHRCLRLIPDFIARAEPGDWEVRVDGVALPRDLLLVEVMNGPLIGPNLQPAALAQPGDGLLDVAFLRPEGRAALLRAMARSEEEGGIPRPLPLEHVRGREVTLRLRDTVLRLDDDFETLGAEPQEMTLTLTRPPVHILLPTAAQGG